MAENIVASFPLYSCREVVERRTYTVTGQKASAEEIDRLIETGESEQIFQKAILEQGRGHVRSCLPANHSLLLSTSKIRIFPERKSTAVHRTILNAIMNPHTGTRHTGGDRGARGGCTGAGEEPAGSAPDLPRHGRAGGGAGRDAGQHRGAGEGPAHRPLVWADPIGEPGQAGTSRQRIYRELPG